MKTYTEKELKAMVTPEIIKKMVELAEGFRFIDTCYPKIKTPNWRITHGGAFWLMELMSDGLTFSTLIHRAAEGYNKYHRNNLTSFNEIKTGLYCVKKLSLLHDKIEYLYKNYEPENLTACELACLHCLIEILSEE